MKEALKWAITGWGFGADAENDAAGIFEGDDDSPSTGDAMILLVLGDEADERRRLVDERTASSSQVEFDA